MQTKAIFLFIVFFSSGFLFLNCSQSEQQKAPQNSAQSSDSLSLLSETPYTIDSSNYTIQNYKLTTESGRIYFQFVSACATKCPVVVVSLPYTGINWSGDSLDQLWGAKDPSGLGIIAADVNGPNYNAVSSDVIAYYNSPVSDAVGFGGIFLNSGVSTVLVYNRFYLGRKLDQYVNDFTKVLNYLPNFKTIDTSQVALLGASLGGFVSLHASRQSTIKPKVIVGITPLIDLENEYPFMNTVNSRVTSNPSLLTSSGNFFRSYLRRMDGVQLNQFNCSQLASGNASSQILIIHDTWDTIVPIIQWQNYSAIRPVDSFIFQHATGINFNTFSMDHGQASEGFNKNAIVPIFMSYILSRLKAPSETKSIYYYYNDFLIAIIQAKEAKVRGQNINWIKNLMTDLCTNNTNLKDISGTMSQLTGAQFVGGVLVNIWNAPTTIDQGCQYLVDHPLYFN